MSSTSSDDQAPGTLLRDLEDICLAVIKIGNISWDLTSGDVLDFLGGSRIGKDHIHIPIDRSTGKTKADMFVELPSLVEAIRCVAKYNKRILKGRSVTLSISSHEELFDAHFPSLLLDPWGREPLTAEEIQSIVAICRDYKVCITPPRTDLHSSPSQAHFSRKCAERPFEHVISILHLVPWQCLRDEQVERMYDLVLGAVEALTDHLQRTSAAPPSRLGSVHSLELAKCGDAVPMSPTTNALAPAALFPTGGASPQLKGELLGRLLCAADAFPPFSERHRMDFIKATRALSLPKLGQSMPLPADLKAKRHLRKSSIDRILEELSSTGRRTKDVDRMMKQAFQQIMLSTDASPSKPL